MSHICAETSKL